MAERLIDVAARRARNAFYRRSKVKVAGWSQADEGSRVMWRQVVHDVAETLQVPLDTLERDA